MTAYQVWAILRAAHPRVRGIEALATIVLLFLLLFAATYFLMSHTSSSNFNVHALTRTDSIYFTVTVFATVGFGDISPASQVARLVVTAQMIFNLIVLGLGVRLIVGAVQQAHQVTRTAETGN
ncbi:MAG TPA: potassium channel family protein [Propionibacteriaceae bacterium]